MNVNAGDGTLKLNGEDLQNVKEFTCSGSKVSTDGNVIREVRTRMAKAAAAFNFLNNIWENQNISRKTKLSLFRSRDLTVLTYGSESWYCTNALENTSNTFENKCFRKILGIRWNEFKSTMK